MREGGVLVSAQPRSFHCVTFDYAFVKREIFLLPLCSLAPIVITKRGKRCFLISDYV